MRLHATPEQLKAQYARCAEGLARMLARAERTGQKVGGLPARINVFGDVLRLRRGKASARLCAIRVERLQAGWQGWNGDPVMEGCMARLPGSGSFYWPCAWRAYLAARRIMRECPEVRQIAIETISGQAIARVYR